MHIPWRRRPRLALALGGGGARGALQVGALRALIEHDICPDFLVGTSVGAINGAFIGLRGWSLATIEALHGLWRKAAAADLLPARTAWLTMYAIYKAAARRRDNPVRNFLQDHGLKPEMRFSVMQLPTFVVVADLNHCQAIIYGDDPDDRVLDAVEASAALPPWVFPISRQGASLMDGGAVSNLPLEPAIARGATRIIALDLADLHGAATETSGMGAFLWRLTTTTQERETQMELALAVAKGVPVLHLHLKPHIATYLWDFSHTDTLIAEGYEIATRTLASQPAAYTGRFSWNPLRLTHLDRPLHA